MSARIPVEMGSGYQRLRRLQAAGNGFLVGFSTSEPDSRHAAQEAVTLCDDASADGLIVAVLRHPHPKPGPVSASMQTWNSDGSAAPVSGNGLLCLAHAAAVELGRGETTMAVRTTAGVRRCGARLNGDSSAADAHAQFGEPGPGPLPEIGSVSPAAACGLPVLRWNTFDAGSRHIVVELPTLDGVSAQQAGPAVAALFSDAVNVHFIAAADAATIKMISWEAGAGATRACGTGAVAAATALRQWGRAHGDVRVVMPGGVALVTAQHGATLRARTQLQPGDAATASVLLCDASGQTRLDFGLSPEVADDGPQQIATEPAAPAERPQRETEQPARPQTRPSPRVDSAA